MNIILFSNLKIKSILSEFMRVLLLGLFLFVSGMPSLFAQLSESENPNGKFVIESNIEDFILLIDDDLGNPLYVSSGDTLELPSGTFAFRGIQQGYHDTKFKGTIYPAQTSGMQINFNKPQNVSPRSSYKTIVNGYNVTIYSEEGAEIFVDQVLIGYSQVSLLLPDTSYELFINHPEFGTLTDKFESALEAQKELHHYFNDYRNIPNVVRFVPGLVYFINDQKSKALFTVGGIGSLIALSGHFINKAQKIRQERETFISQGYVPGPSVDQRFDDYDNDIKKNKRRATLSLIGAGLIYTFTTYKAFKRPKGGYATPPVQFNAQALNRNGQLAPQLHFTFNF